MFVSLAQALALVLAHTSATICTDTRIRTCTHAHALALTLTRPRALQFPICVSSKYPFVCSVIDIHVSCNCPFVCNSQLCALQLSIRVPFTYQSMSPRISYYLCVLQLFVCAPCFVCAIAHLCALQLHSCESFSCLYMFPVIVCLCILQLPVVYPAITQCFCVL